MSTENNKTVWATLNEIDVSKYIKKKGQLSYLAWSTAIGLVKPYYPDVSYKVYKNDLGFTYHTDGKTCWVEVGVTINGVEAIEYLPVMNHSNKSIPLDQLTSVDVNKAIKRATVKALAHHGLGINLYTGEELPSETEDEIANAVLTKEQAKEIQGLIESASDVDVTKLLEFAQADSVENIKASVYPKLKAMLLKKGVKNESN